MSPLLKAIGVGIGTFAIMMVLLWIISKLANRPFITIPQRPVATTSTPVPTTSQFLQ